MARQRKAPCATCGKLISTNGLGAAAHEQMHARQAFAQLRAEVDLRAGDILTHAPGRLTPDRYVVIGFGTVAVICAPERQQPGHDARRRFFAKDFQSITIERATCAD